MLKELFEQQRGTPRADTLRFPEFVEHSVRTFDAFVDFLRDPKRFPNREVNNLVTLNWHLIGNKDIPLVLDQWGVPSLSFTVLGKGSEKKPFFIMPTNFIDLARDDPAMQLGAVAFISSQGKDYHTGALERDGSRIVNLRAQAYEAETLLTLQEMAVHERVSLNWNPYQRSVLSRYPNGLKDLPQHLQYQPKYKI